MIKKTNNRILDFLHQIPIEVYHDTDDVEVSISVNQELKFKKKYIRNIIHRDLVEFRHEYKDAEKNSVTVTFGGTLETANRYLKIKSILINNVYINIYDADYRPILDKIWWNSLNEDNKEKYLDVIYGKNGNTFGWFGEISFSYACGYNTMSKQFYNDSIDVILSKKVDWIFLESAHNNPWERKNDKLL